MSVNENVNCTCVDELQIEQTSEDVARTLSSFQLTFMDAQKSYDMYAKGRDNSAYETLLAAKNIAESILKRSEKWEKGIFKRRQLIPVESSYLLLLHLLSLISSNSSHGNNTNNSSSTE